jgi:protein-S-isoprenylcysteine O-methyltransferase Ste14
MNREIALIALLIVFWVVWAWPFMAHQARAPKREAQVTLKSSRWGIALQMVGYVFAWMGGAQPAPAAAVAAGVAFICLAVLLSYMSVHSLGKQLRVHAGLYPDHELVRGGPYSVMRHPIYAGMLAMYLATALMRGSWPLAAIGLIIFIVGTEIRVHIEDGLLASRFGEQFTEYKASTPAYVPFLR